MIDVLDMCRDFPRKHLEPDEVFIFEGDNSDRVFVLMSGTVEVYRGDVSIALISDPGAIFGEQALLLETAHTANVRAVTPATVHVIDNASNQLVRNPQMLWPIARLLARRLQNSTTYLVDLKQQFQDAEHVSVVDEVLATMQYQQDIDITSGMERPRSA